MPLTDKEIRTFKPKDSNYKRFDSHGLHMIVTPAGGRLWRLKYAFNGKENLLALGKYPDVSLAQARERRDEARKLLAQGVDPNAAKAAEKKKGEQTFEAVTRLWLTTLRETPRNAEMILHRLEKYVFPWLGRKSIHELTGQDVLAVVRRTADRGATEMSRRLLQYIRRTLDHAVIEGLLPLNPAAGLTKALPRPVTKHHAAIITPKDVGPLMRALDGYDGSFVVACALKLLALTFVRQGELRGATWAEIDLDTAEWRIPAERMKMKRPHVVPLSRQAVGILRELHALTGPDGFVFPSIRTKARVMSENTINAGLRRLGYEKDQMTGHGFRSMASTILHEQGWPTDVIERQLAHVERDTVKAAYNHAEHLPERRKMMRAWADYLDGLKTGGRIVPIRTTAINAEPN